MSAEPSKKTMQIASTTQKKQKNAHIASNGGLSAKLIKNTTHIASFRDVQFSRSTSRLGPLSSSVSYFSCRSSPAVRVPARLLASAPPHLSSPPHLRLLAPCPAAIGISVSRPTLHRTVCTSPKIWLRTGIVQLWRPGCAHFDTDDIRSYVISFRARPHCIDERVADALWTDTSKNKNKKRT